MSSKPKDIRDVLKNVAIEAVTHGRAARRLARTATEGSAMIRGGASDRDLTQFTVLAAIGHMSSGGEEKEAVEQLKKFSFDELQKVLAEEICAPAAPVTEQSGSNLELRDRFALAAFNALVITLPPEELGNAGPMAYGLAETAVQARNDDSSRVAFAVPVAGPVPEDGGAELKQRVHAAIKREVESYQKEQNQTGREPGPLQ